MYSTIDIKRANFILNVLTSGRAKRVPRPAPLESTDNIPVVGKGAGWQKAFYERTRAIFSQISGIEWDFSCRTDESHRACTRHLYRAGTTIDGKACVMFLDSKVFAADSTANY